MNNTITHSTRVQTAASFEKSDRGVRCRDPRGRKVKESHVDRAS
jgi:hypothetical protein